MVNYKQCKDTCKCYSYFEKTGECIHKKMCVALDLPIEVDIEGDIDD